jgi:hypothetical protein
VSLSVRVRERVCLLRRARSTGERRGGGAEGAGGGGDMIATVEIMVHWLKGDLFLDIVELVGSGAGGGDDGGVFEMRVCRPMRRRSFSV